MGMIIVFKSNGTIRECLKRNCEAVGLSQRCYLLLVPASGLSQFLVDVRVSVQWMGLDETMA